MTKVDRRMVKCILGIKAEATDKILCRIIDDLPLLGSLLEVERRMYDLSPMAGFV